jgi:hypothetical protein
VQDELPALKVPVLDGLDGLHALDDGADDGLEDGLVGRLLARAREEHERAALEEDLLDGLGLLDERRGAELAREAHPGAHVAVEDVLVERDDGARVLGRRGARRRDGRGGCVRVRVVAGVVGGLGRERGLREGEVFEPGRRGLEPARGVWSAAGAGGRGHWVRAVL